MAAQHNQQRFMQLPPAGHPQISVGISNQYLGSRPLYFNGFSDGSDIAQPVLTRSLCLNMHNRQSQKFREFVYAQLGEDPELKEEDAVIARARKSVEDAIATRKAFWNDIPIIKSLTSTVEVLQKAVRQARTDGHSDKCRRKQQELQDILRMLRTHKEENKPPVSKAGLNKLKDDRMAAIRQYRDLRSQKATPEKIAELLRLYLEQKLFPSNSFELLGESIIQPFLKGDSRLYELEQSNAGIYLHRGEIPKLGKYTFDNRLRFPLELLLQGMSLDRTVPLLKTGNGLFVFAPQPQQVERGLPEQFPNAVLIGKIDAWTVLLEQHTLINIICDDDELCGGGLTRWFMKTYPHPSHPKDSTELSMQGPLSEDTTSDDEETEPDETDPSVTSQAQTD